VLPLILLKSFCYAALAMLHLVPSLVPEHWYRGLTGLLYLTVAAFSTSSQAPLGNPLS